MDTSHFRPVPTCEIPMPIDEGSGSSDPVALPRILRQAAGTASASRRVLVLVAVFLSIAAGELSFLLHLPAPEPLVVYHDAPRITLLEPEK
jgi:hypothetical protein